KPGRPLNVGETLRVLSLIERKLLAACDGEMEVPDQFLAVELTDPKEVDDLAVQVVEDLDDTRLLVKENLGPTGERLDISQPLGPPARAPGRAARPCPARFRGRNT